MAVKQIKKSVKTKAIVPKKVASVKVVTKKSSDVAVGVSVPLFNQAGEKEGTTKLPKEIFGSTANESLIAQGLRVYQANQHQGTVSTKTRGEVVGSTRKIYRQKGTGRARHGSIKAPIFVGGGIVFGPKPRDVHKELPKKMRRQVLMAVLKDKVDNHALSVISDFSSTDGKTKGAFELLKKMGLMGKHLLIVLELPKIEARRSLRNIANLRILPPHSLSPLDVVMSDHLVLTSVAVKQLTERYQKEIH